MNHKSTLLFFCLVSLFITFTVSCNKNSDDDSVNTKPATDLKGTSTGTATNKANSADKKALSINITSTDNPIAGTYTLVNATGKLSGSALGLILNITFKPDAAGTTYTFSGSADTNKITGTMTGVESTTTVVYDVVLTK